MTTPDLTTALEEKRAIINAAYEASGKGRDRTANEIYARVIALSALAAVQEVLNLADRLDSDDRTSADRATARMFREAITRELTGKETGDAGT